MTELLSDVRPAVSSGIAGLDDVLAGGFTRGQLFLVEGIPGSGKTTLALQFLMAAARRDEVVLYVSLSESGRELRASAASHGWALDGIDIRELAPGEAALEPDAQTTMFHPSELELASTTKMVIDDVERLKPSCVVIDSLSELRLLAGAALSYRRQILALKQFFAARECTVLVLDDLTGTERDLQIQSIAHGVLLLEQDAPQYGVERRRLRVLKLRGAQFRGGFHDYLIRRGGLQVFPRLVAAEHRQVNDPVKLASGLTELDSLLGGGIEEGTSTLMVGAAGTGKSTLAAQFVGAAAARGQHASMWLFDESPATLVSRCAGLGIDLKGAQATGRVAIRQVDPAELSPGEFAHAIREAVERDGSRIIVIDSLNGYLNAMPGEGYLSVQLHEMLMYLGQKGVATILIGAHQGLIGGGMTTPVDASYLADAVVLLRYFESRGEVRQAISVVKKRGSEHERTIREMQFEKGRIRIGEALRQFRGVLTGVPVFEGADNTLMPHKPS